MKLNKYISPQTLDEAFEILIAAKRNTILGGGCFTGISTMKKNVGISLDNLSLNYIKEDEKNIFIGSNNSLREVESNPLVKNIGNGIISKAINSIGVGIQLKNTATFGGSVYSKYGFSDIMPVLLVLDAQLNFYKRGIIKAEEYMNMEPEKDILLEVIIEKNKNKGLYFSRRLSKMDIPQLNLAIILGEDIKISIGARPRKAIRCDFLSKYLEGNTLINDEDIGTLDLGSNIKSSKELRERLLQDIFMELRKELE